MRRIVLGVVLAVCAALGARDVVLLGDSIRLGYGPDVKKILEARGDRVFQPSDNCRYALYTLRSLPDWVKLVPDPAQVEAVHWNNGLWDIGELLPGECTTPVDVYAAFVARTARHLRHYFPHAKLVFATTTPINEKETSHWHTLGNGVVDEYNGAARAALAGKVDAIDDLNAFVRTKGVAAHYQDIVHFKPEGCRILAEEVVRVLDAVCAAPAAEAGRDPALILDSSDAAWNALDDAALRQRAQGVLQHKVHPVTEKKVLPPSGDAHDYMSMGPYWWPDPAKKNGLPYIRRDGRVNPETTGANCDRERLDRLARDVSALAGATRRFGDHAAGREAARRLRVFFLDDATRMNPHLEYGQSIPGRCTGRGIGIIDTLGPLVLLPDAIRILHGAGDLSDADFACLRDWFARYLDWLTASKNGRDERAAKNNHGSAYDLQCAILALFTGREEQARDILKGVPARRIDPQIEPDGRQPEELARTKALGYSTMNVRILCQLALLGEKLGVDLWHYESPKGGSIPKAVDFLVPYWRGEKKWTWQQIEPFGPSVPREPMSVRAHFSTRR